MLNIRQIFVPLLATAALTLGATAQAGDARIGGVAPAHHYSTTGAPASRYQSHYTRNRHVRSAHRSAHYRGATRRYHNDHHYRGRSHHDIHVTRRGYEHGYGHRDYRRGYDDHYRYRHRGHGYAPRRSGIYFSPYGLTIHLRPGG